MILSAQVNNQSYKINTDEPLDIAIPLDFSGAQPNAYDVEGATVTPCKTGTLVGDTRRGGSCNFEQITFIPHCNGTHTECIGHITHERISIRDCLKDAFISAMLISVKPEKAFETKETYPVGLDENDKLITLKAIQKALGDIENNPEFQIIHPKPDGLIVRTLPNDVEKKTRVYMKNLPPFFSTEAMEFMIQRRINHLLVDVPSIDRTFDEGRLSNHRIFWNVAQGSHEVREASFVNNTITEMIYVPEAVADGAYLLNLQTAAFVSDAAPSRPILFKLFE